MPCARFQVKYPQAHQSMRQSRSKSHAVLSFPALQEYGKIGVGEIAVSCTTPRGKGRAETRRSIIRRQLRPQPFSLSATYINPVKYPAAD